MLRIYEAKFGVNRRPPPELEPTGEQLTCLRTILGTGQAPYAEFCVFGPYALRRFKDRKLHGVTFNEDGELLPIQILGPPNMETWQSCWGVYKVAMLMLEAVDLGVLDSYEKEMLRYHQLYGGQ